MAPVQTFSSSPITAAKAPAPTAAQSPSPAARKTAAQTTTAGSYGSPLSAQQGSRPLIPSATSSVSTPPHAAVAATTTAFGHVQPTPTTSINNIHDGSPPAPQPGAVPTPQAVGATHASASTTLPPPPKKGETLGPEHTGVASVAPPPAYPPPPAQMAYPPPTASHSIRGTSTTANTLTSPGPVPLPVGTALGGGVNHATDLSHPPGYQQDTRAGDFSSGQRAAHEAYVAQNSAAFGMLPGSGGGGGDMDGEGSIWGTAKKWAAAAGDTLAAAEGEVWKAVNKDQK